ncbi:acyl-CoA thioesterase domain-containing protein [Sphaerimonospora mesophila]|uniref:acyl-CoA thioesterase domain-containing protein n=1 Tax=Sphaerimonospora mesophila TaxID=37483 RepID=UPI0006E12063
MESDHVTECPAPADAGGEQDGSGRGAGQDPVEAPWPRGGLVPGPAGSSFEVPVGPELCGPNGRLFGGWGLGMLADAVRRSTGRRLADLSVSYLRPVEAGSRLGVHCEPLAEGRSLGHYRVTATDRGRPAFVGAAVAGPAAGQVRWGADPPRPPAPQDCPERTYRAGPGTGTSVLLDVREAGERPGAGAAASALLWARLRCAAPDEVRLAVVSDHVPYLLLRAFPGLAGAITVSASLRLLGGPVAEWILLDVSLVASAERMAVGRVVMWSGGTTLAGVAGQTARLIPG